MKTSSGAHKKNIFGRFLDSWPGKKRFGRYRFLPIFFCVGAAVEFAMINWHVGEVNFYKVFKEKEAERQALKNLAAKSTLSAQRNRQKTDS